MNMPYDAPGPEWSRRLREERLRLEFDEHSFADLIGANSWNRVRALETGSMKPSRPLSSIELACMAAHGVDIQYVLIGQRSIPDASLAPDEAALLDNYRNTPQEHRSTLAEVIQVYAASGKVDKGPKTGSH